LTDRREAILARLLTILSSVSGIASAKRNRGQIDESVRPALVLLDADEEPEHQETSFRHGRPATSPLMMAMSPEIYLLLPNAEPDDEDRGLDLNTWRVLVLKAILTDTTLSGLLGRNGEARYMGCLTDYATGRAMDGTMRFNFTFTYVFNPNEL
jgi:hypothetical protein